MIHLHYDFSIIFLLIMMIISRSKTNKSKINFATKIGPSIFIDMRLFDLLIMINQRSIFFVIEG